MKRLKYNLSLVIALGLCTVAVAQEERSRTIDETWSNINHLVVHHRYGDLQVIPHNSPEVRLDAVIVVRANDAADAQTIIDHFDIKMQQQGDRLTLNTHFDTKNWITIGGNTRITFNDGAKANSIKDLSIDYQLRVPNLQTLDITNKYEDITIQGNLRGDLIVNQYDARITAQDVDGKLTLTLKYGEGEIGQVGDASLDIYDSELKVEGTGTTTVTSKYSDYEIGESTSLDIKSYDDDLQIGQVRRALKIVDKYSDIRIGQAGSTHFETYDTDVQIDETGAHSGLSAHSTYVIKRAQSIDLDKSYDDDFRVESLESLVCGESKHSGYKIGKLSRSATLTVSYDDEFTVNEVSPEFTSFTIDSKYTDVTLPLNQVPGYQLEANTRFGKLRYPEPSGHTKHIEKGNELELSATIGRQGTRAKVTITAYDSQISLNK